MKSLMSYILGTRKGHWVPNPKGGEIYVRNDDGVILAYLTERDGTYLLSLTNDPYIDNVRFVSVEDAKRWMP